MSSFNNNPEIELVAGADIDIALLNSFYEATGASVYDSVEAMCQDENVDLVHIATPNWLHLPHTLTALDHGKHVLVEKPMAMTLEAADEIVARSRCRLVRPAPAYVYVGLERTHCR
jgi:phthalate 4,5-cis-dihydrodiol dehydrogenase